MSYVELGVDPAIAGGNAIIAARFDPNEFVILDCQIDYDLRSTEKQIGAIATMGRLWRPSALVIEADSQQIGLVNDERLRAVATMLGTTVVPHYTRGLKIDVPYGVATMNQSFIRREIRIPFHDDPHTRGRIEPLVNQLRSWRPDKTSKQLRQDAVMAMWMIWRRWAQNRDRRQESTQARPHRPSWVSSGPRRIAI